MLAHLPWLSFLIWTPILGGLILLRANAAQHADRARYMALAISLFSVLMCVPLYYYYDPSTYAMQFIENIDWINALSIRYQLGVDGISLTFIILSAFTSLIVVMAAWNTVNEKVAQYMATFLFTQGLMVGVFAALDAILFYVFWEALLVPVYISIGVWGSANRSYASIKFFLYTFAGSALMLVALLYLGVQAGNFNIMSFYDLKIDLTTQVIIFFAFLLAFAVKVPMWPVHTWLPDAHTEAPAGGSVILAALMLKLGGYGFLRFSLPIVPDASAALDTMMIGLSLVAIVYIGFVAIVQTDMKKLIAYSSIAHMGFATLGCYMVFDIIRRTGQLSEAFMSLEGAMVQMVSHAFSSGAMFVAVGILYHYMHSRLIGDFGGLVHKMPVFSALFMLFAMTNVGLPGTSGFVGEFMVILSSFRSNPWVTFLAATSLILGASYTLWMYKRVFFGVVTNPDVEKLTDIRGFNLWSLGLLAVPIIVIGVYPDVLLNLLHATVAHLLQVSHQTKIF
jgi:NADH-quinone oxidoreductase subunit M